MSYGSVTVTADSMAGTWFCWRYCPQGQVEKGPVTAMGMNRGVEKDNLSSMVDTLVVQYTHTFTQTPNTHKPMYTYTFLVDAIWNTQTWQKAIALNFEIEHIHQK